MLLFWILLTVVVCFFLYLYMIMPNTSRRSKILPYLKRDYAHCGLHDSSRLIPENSMPAFREAVKQNLAIELDIHLTRDGKVVVFHDESLKRICNAEGTVENSTFDTLQHLHLSGTSEHMPLFSDVLRYVNGRVPLLIELKLPDSNMKLCPAAWDILKDYPENPFLARFCVQFLLTNLICRPDFISYKLADTGNPSVWLNHYLYRIPMAVWTLRNQKVYKTARNKYDMYIFEGFSVK